MPDLAIATEVNPNAGIDTISKYIGLQRQQTGLAQQRQALQTGQFEQQTAQATSEQAQQRNRELQSVGNLISTAHQTKRYDNPDGGFNRQLFSDDVAQVAPTYGQEISGRAMSTANEIVANRQAHSNLSVGFQHQMGSGFAALATKDDLTNSDVIDELDRQLSINKDPEFRRMALSMAAHLPPNATPQQLKDTMQRWSIAATAPEAASATTMPKQTTNAGQQIVNVKPTTGAISAPPQTGASAGNLNPSAPTVAAATRTSAGTAEDDVRRNEQISQSVAPSRGAITLADQISNLSDQVHTGKFSKAVTDYMATIGQDNPEIAARQLISKYAAQLKTVATANAPTDAARAQIDAGFPDPEHMSPEAIRGASEYIKGNMLMNLSRASNARRFTQAHGNTMGLRTADDQLTSVADPLMYTYQNLPAGQQRQDFIRRHFNNAQDAADFVRRKNAVEHYGGFAE